MAGNRLPLKRLVGQAEAADGRWRVERGGALDHRLQVTDLATGAPIASLRERMMRSKASLQLGGRSVTVREKLWASDMVFEENGTELAHFGRSTIRLAEHVGADPLLSPLVLTGCFLNTTGGFRLNKG